MKIKYEDLEKDIRGYLEAVDLTQQDTVLVAVGRGGMGIAPLVSHITGVSNVEYINYSRKRGWTGKSFEWENLIGKDILIVDDFIETGGSLQKIEKIILLMAKPASLSVFVYGKLNSSNFCNVNFIYSLDSVPVMPWENEE